MKNYISYLIRLFNFYSIDFLLKLLESQYYILYSSFKIIKFSYISFYIYLINSQPRNEFLTTIAGPILYQSKNRRYRT